MVIKFRNDLVRDVGDQIFKWLLCLKKIHTRANLQNKHFYYMYNKSVHGKTHIYYFTYF